MTDSGKLFQALIIRVQKKNISLNSNLQLQEIITLRKTESNGTRYRSGPTISSFDNQVLTAIQTAD